MKRKGFPQNVLLGELPADRKVRPWERVAWGGRHYVVRQSMQHRDRGLFLFDCTGVKSVKVGPVAMLSGVEQLLGIPSVKPAIPATPPPIPGDSTSKQPTKGNCS